MPVLDRFDKAIIHFLANIEKSNTNDIAEKLEMSWGTARDHLKKLFDLGFVLTKNEGKMRVWRLNR